MIFKSLHEKLLRKKINKSLIELSKQHRVKSTPIKSLGCIIDPSFPVSVDLFIDLAHSVVIFSFSNSILIPETG